MRVKFSERVNKLTEEIKPYLDIHTGIKSDAPEEIKQKHRELCELIDKEYAAAGGIVI